MQPKSLIRLDTRALRAAAAAFAFAASLATPALAAKVGDAAPAFTGKDIDGKAFSLSDAKGKYVVLEWHNQGCPFVQKHYGSGNMQKLQEEWTAKGVVWVSVISSAEGKQGYVTPEEEKKYLAEQKAKPSTVLLDPEGTIGKAYDAKVTPHMYVVSPEGKLIYNGAIDNVPSTDEDDIKKATNYVSEALTLAMAGKPVATPSSTPYGCGMKYKD
jgi:peroxiredoxin